MPSDAILNDVLEAWKRRRQLVHFNTIWNDVFFLKFWNAKKKAKQGRFILTQFELLLWKLELLKKMKAKTPTGTFWHYLKRCFFLSWNRWESFWIQGCLIVQSDVIETCLRNKNDPPWTCWEIKDANWCVLRLFKTFFF